MAYKLGANQLEDAFVRMKALADRKKDIYEEDIEALVDQEIANAHDHIKLASLTVIAGTHGPQRRHHEAHIGGQNQNRGSRRQRSASMPCSTDIKCWCRTRQSWNSSGPCRDRGY